MKKILILGGYGNTGKGIAKLLLQETTAEILIAGRNLEKARALAEKLNRDFHSDRVISLKIDAASTNSLSEAFSQADLVVVASSTIDYVNNVANAALAAGIDYFDTQLSSRTKLDVLKDLKDEISTKGLCFITDGGYHPGVPAAMARYAANKLDALKVANIGAAFQMNWQELEISKATSSEFIEELSDFNPTVFKDGRWNKLSMKEMPEFDLGDKFGKKYCVPMYMEELQFLPDEIPSLRETGFYIAGFNWMTDYIIMPIAMMLLKIFGESVRKSMGTFFNWGLENFSKPPYGAVLQMEAEGTVNGKSSSMLMRLSHDDPYALTAIPVVACLLQYLKGEMRKEGLWFQANLVEPIQFFADIERLGVETTIIAK